MYFVTHQKQSISQLKQLFVLFTLSPVQVFKLSSTPAISAEASCLWFWQRDSSQISIMLKKNKKQPETALMLDG